MAGPTATATAERVVHEAMTSGFFNPITNNDVKTAVKALEGLTPQEASQAVKDLAADGTLKTLAAEINDGSILGLGGLSQDEKRDFLNAMAGKLDGASLKALGDGFAAADPTFHGRDDIGLLGGAIAAHAPAATKVDYVRAQAGALTDHPTASSGPGATTVTRHGDADAAAVAAVLGSLKGQPAAAREAFGALTPDGLHAVLDAAVDRTDIQVVTANPYGGAPSYSSSTALDAKPFRAVLESAAQLPDARLKAQVFDDAGKVMKAVPDQNLLVGVSVGGRDQALKQMAAGMTTLLKSDPGGVMAQLAGARSTLDGQAFSTYAKEMLNSGGGSTLGDIMKTLQVGGASAQNPANYFEHEQPVTLPNGSRTTRYDNAEALGYFVGGVQAAAQSITSDRKEQADLITGVLKSGLTLLDKYKVGGLQGQIAASVAKEWVSMGVNAALKELRDDPGAVGKAMDLASIPTDPADGRIAVGSGSRSAYNTALDTVLRNAKP